MSKRRSVCRAAQGCNKPQTKKVRRKKRKTTRKPVRSVEGVELRRVLVRDIKRAQYNPRRKLKPGDPDYEKLKTSLTKFGLVDPLVWNERSGNLVGGHQRLAVLVAEHGAKEIDVSVVDLSPADERLLNITLNKVAGGWDDMLLAELLAELSAMPDVDVELTGFDEAEIALTMREALRIDEKGAADSAPKSPELRREYNVLVLCRSEKEQRKVFKTNVSAGFTCRVLTL